MIILTLGGSHYLSCKTCFHALLLRAGFFLVDRNWVTTFDETGRKNEARPAPLVCCVWCRRLQNPSLASGMEPLDQYEGNGLRLRTNI